MSIIDQTHIASVSGEPSLSHPSSEETHPYISTNEFQLVKIDGDGACLYHCFTHYLTRQSARYLNIVQLFLDYQRVALPVVQGETIDNLHLFFRDESIPLDAKSAWIQQAITDWTYNHREDVCIFPLRETAMELQDIVLSTVGQQDGIETMEDYHRVFQEYTGIRNKHWGGINDIEVFSYLFHARVHLYQLYKMNKHGAMESSGQRFFKSGMIRVEAIFQPFLLDEEVKELYMRDLPATEPLMLLYGGNRKEVQNHYSVLIKNSIPSLVPSSSPVAPAPVAPVAPVAPAPAPVAAAPAKKKKKKGKK